MDIGNNTETEFELKNKEDLPLMSIFIKCEPDEYELDEANFRQDNNVSNNGNNELSINEDEAIIRLKDEFKSVYAEDSINNPVDKQNFPSHIEQVFTPVKNKGAHKCSVCAEGFLTLQTLNTHMLTHANHNPFICEFCGKSFSKEAYLKKYKQIPLTSTCCGICTERFAWKFHLSEHIRIHTEEKLYECEICKEKFSSKEKTKCHIRDHLNNGEFNDCPICGKGFKAPWSLKRHMRCHSNRKPFECQFCERQFPTLQQVSSHMLFHENKKFLKCNVCFKKFLKTSNLRRHRKTHKCIHPENTPFECDICKRKFTKRFRIQEHIFIHVGDGGEHKCELCEIGFSTLKMLERHLRGHSELEPFACEFCHHRFLRKQELTQHWLVHSDKKPFNCKKCDQSFERPSQLEVHKRNHFEGVFECDICKKRFQSHFWIREHIVSHIGDGGVHKCEVCGVGFSIPKMLKRHLRGHLDYKPFECQVCKDRFSRKYDLAQHMLFHDNGGDFICNQCGKNFKKKVCLTLHKKRHALEKSLECEICNEQFLTISKFKRHMLRHQNNKLYLCHICDNAYSEWTELRQHKMYEHRKPYTCTKCDKDFVRECNLEKHMSKHVLNEKLTRHKNEQTSPTKLQNTFLECNICKTKFKDNYRLKFHMVAHTGDGGPLKCSVCAKGFSIPYVLKIHLQEHKNRKRNTLEKSFECDVCKKRFKFEKNLKSHKTIHVKGKSKKSSDGRIRKQKVLSTIRLKSAIKSEVVAKNNSNEESEEQNFMTEEENSTFISVKKESYAILDLHQELDIEDIKIPLTSER